MRAFARFDGDVGCRSSVVGLLLGASLACSSDDGTADTGGSTGDALGPPPVCLDYLECAGKLAPRSLPELVATYGEDGSCWVSQEMADQCEMACIVGLNGLQALDTNDECPGAPATSSASASGGSGSDTSTSG